MSFLLLRPQSKCLASAQAFNQAKLQAVACGLIDTVLDTQAIAELPDKIRQLSNGASTQSIIIVTSTVAAEQAVLCKTHWPECVTFFAVGHSTAKILQQSGLQVTVPDEARTEGLLALPSLQHVKDTQIIIMKGFGGRELLYDTLIARQARVEEWEVYKRVVVSQPVSTGDWRTAQISCIIATSGEVIQAAFDHFEPSWLQSLNWIVVSQRTAAIASTLGVTQIDISRDASDKALIQCAQQYTTRARHSSEH